MTCLAISLLIEAAIFSPEQVSAKPQAQPPTASLTDRSPLKESGNDGIWPSERLMRSLLRRWADRMSETFELEPAGREEIRRATVDRWERFLKENRDELQPLFNEFLEMRLGENPPGEIEVRRWAARALPTLEQLKAEAQEATAQIRDLVPPRMAARFEAEAIKMGLGLQAASEKLKHWKEGTYEREEVWQAPRRERKKADRTDGPTGRVADVQDSSNSPIENAVPEADDSITAELTRWERFVGDVIKTYGYDKSQAASAQSFLQELKGRAVAYRDRYKGDIARLEKRIHENSGSEDEISRITADLVSLYGPIDEMFQELKSRVESIATTQQRIRAAEKDKAEKAREKSETLD